MAFGFYQHGIPDGLFEFLHFTGPTAYHMAQIDGMFLPQTKQ
jgi:hypothetical protein